MGRLDSSGSGGVEQNGSGAVEFIRPSFGLSFLAFASLFMYAYYHLAYRVRHWGRLPRRRGATLTIANHQHDLDDKVTISYLQLGGPLNRTIYSAAGRRMFETGFLGFAFPWFEKILESIDLRFLFRWLGMMPIENQLRTRSVTGYARAVYDLHGDLALQTVFHEDTLREFDPSVVDAPLSILFTGRLFRKGRQTDINIKTVNEPYRSELIAQMRESIERDLTALGDLLKRGETLWLTPEGQFTKTGRMNPLRTALRRFGPLAERVYVIAISYDVFVGRRFSMLFRVVLPSNPNDLENSLKAARPVTVSQLIADWLYASECSAPSERSELGVFSKQDALTAVQDRLAHLPPAAWVDPDLHKSPERMTRAAISGMLRLGVLQRRPGGYALMEKRQHPQFPNVKDIVAHQAAMFEESKAAWAA